MTDIITVDSRRHLGEKLKSLGGQGLLLCLDNQVSKYHGKELGLDPTWPIHTVPGLEEAKSFDTLRGTLEFFLSQNLTRTGHHLVAIGGGSVCDMTGLAASLLFRGIPWTIVPTTLLAMVDGAIGGKTAVNVGGYKNQVGQFHKPRHVLLCWDFLDSLPPREKESGLGEIVKYCFLDHSLHETVTKGASLHEIILACAYYKKALTDKDPRDKGARQCLNLGHTLGHAFESLYNLPHGTAVLWGMHTLFSLFQRESCLEELSRLLRRLGLTLDRPPWGKPEDFPVEAVFQHVLRDKKRIGLSDITLVDCRGPGQVGLRPMALSRLRELLEDHFS